MEGLKGMSNQEDDDHKQLITRASKAIDRLKKNVPNDPHRLNYHFMGPASWINDPNGLIYFKGEYHLFYQLHPYSAKNGSKHWGHAKSKDLVYWEHLPIALAPIEDYERHGCFSGTAVNNHGIFTLIYTGNVILETGEKKQVQCIATSTDGLVFTKHRSNPVITDFPKEGSADFRDPKVWRHQDKWYMAVGSGKDGKANALLYTSDDLISWDYVGKMTESKNSRQGIIWNCPYFFRFGGKDIMLVSPAVHPNSKEAYRTLYMIGNMNYESGKFTQKSDGIIDYGPDFYAPQTLKDEHGRIVLIGWLDMWWNEMPTQAYGWAGAMSLPRIVSFSSDGTLKFTPLPELQVLRKDHRCLEQIYVKPQDYRLLGNLQGDSLELKAEIDLSDCEAEEFGFKVRCSKSGAEKTLVTYNGEKQELIVDRSHTGIVKSGISKCRLEPTKHNKIKLHIFLDKSSVEIFANGGRVVMSHRIYPNPASLGVEVMVRKGSVKFVSIDVWKLKSIW